MARAKFSRTLVLPAMLTLCGAVTSGALSPAFAQSGTSAGLSAGDSLHGGVLEVPLNKSEIVTSARPFKRAIVGNEEIADVMPMTNKTIYVLGKKMGTTNLSLYDDRNMLIGVVDVAVGPDVDTLRKQLQTLLPGQKIGAYVSNDAVVLTGTVSSGVALDRAVQIARTYVGEEKVVNMMSVGATQQVMLEVRFSEISRGAAKQLGFNHSFLSNRVYGSVGNLAGPSTLGISDSIKAAQQALVNGEVAIPPAPTIKLSSLADAFGVGTWAYKIGSLNLFSSLDALERKGLVKTLAEPNLVALSGETASFLAGGEFPIPVVQSGTTGASNNSGNAITVQFKPFGVSLSFTPTVLEDGVINLAVEPEVSSIDPSASVTIGGLVIPGLQTRRASTTLELRDGESFALAGLLRKDFQDTVRQFPVLGSIPIIGTLFRSTGFQRNESELVIIVTPRLVKPFKGEASLPTDRAMDPHELDLFLMGRTDKGVGFNPLNPDAPPPEAGKGHAPAPAAPAAPSSSSAAPPPNAAPAPAAQPGMKGENGYEL